MDPSLFTRERLEFLVAPLAYRKVNNTEAAPDFESSSTHSSATYIIMLNKLSKESSQDFVVYKIKSE